MTLFLVIQCLRIQDADHQRRFYRSVQIGHSRFPDQIVQVLRTARLWIYLSLRLGKTIELHWLGFMLDRLVAVNLLNHPRNRGIELQPTDYVGASRWLLPRTNGVGTEPTPESGAADLGDHAWSDHLLADIGQGQARERQPEAMRQLTGGFYLYHDAGGKTGRDAHPEVVLQGLADEPVQIVCATCSRSGAECLGAPR